MRGTTDNQDPSSPLATLGRSILSIRRDQVHAMESALEQHLASFQKLVSSHFLLLASSVDADHPLSLSWIQDLLAALLSCLDEFRTILFDTGSGGSLSKPPLERMISEFLDRSVKVLDVCNAVRDGIEQIRLWHKNLEIVTCALNSKSRLGEGPVRRARKALTDLTILMLDDKDAGSLFAQRNRSFGRHNKDHRHPPGHSRSLSWSVSRSWSAARQLQAIVHNLTPPRNNDIVATGGLAVPVYTMSSVLLFAMCALVAAIPCQDRGLPTHFFVPRHFSWAGSILSLHDRIVEESRRRDRRNSCGLLKEIYQMEHCTRHLTDLVDGIQFPLTEERESEVRQAVQELMQVCDAFKNGLDPLERQVREVFHRIVRARTEGLDCLEKFHNS